MKSWLQRRWPAIRRQGLLRWLLVRGGLVFGGGMSVLVYALLLLAERRQGLHLGAVAPLVPALCIPAGLLWALVMWHWNEFLYRKLGFDETDKT